MKITEKLQKKIKNRSLGNSFRFKIIAFQINLNHCDDVWTEKCGQTTENIENFHKIERNTINGINH